MKRANMQGWGVGWDEKRVTIEPPEAPTATLILCRCVHYVTVCAIV